MKTNSHVQKILRLNNEFIDRKEFHKRAGDVLVEMGKDELPVETATSLAIEGFSTLDRNVILPALLKSAALTFALWESGSSLPFEQYRQVSSTLGKEVEVHLPTGQILKSLAVGINEIGELQLADGTRVNVGDVIHLR